MNFKFSTISERDFYFGNKLKKEFSAKVVDIEHNTKQNGEKYGKFLLSQEKSKIVALAYGQTYELVKNVLKKSNKFIKFPRGTFSCKAKNKKFPSNSTCKFDLTFVDGSTFIVEAKSTPSSSQVQNADNDSACSLQEAISQLETSTQTITRKVKAIKFKGGKIYRYLGCKVCSFSIRRKHSDGKYYCKGACNNRKARKSKVGVACERKICFTIYNVKLSDDQNYVITESAVIFNSVCELLLRKYGREFDTDDEAVEAWEQLITRNYFDLTLKRKKKKKGSVYASPIVVDLVNNVISFTPANNFVDPSITYADNGSEFSTDQGDDFRGEKKKRKRVPDFLKYDMKLMQTTETYTEWAGAYQINSKPRGLVLLINNYNFAHYKKEPKREGSEIDIKFLQAGFLEMGYQIYGNKCQTDVKTPEQFAELIRDYKNQLIKEKVDSIFVIISSHGLNLKIELSEGMSICVVEDLMIPFSDKEFPEYQGKPKVFMPIVCQNFDRNECRKSLNYLTNKLFDMLVCCPALPGYGQERNSNNGTLFVNLLMYNLMKYATSWDFVQILNKVQDDFKEQIERKQLTEWTVPHHYGSTFRPFHLIPRTTAGCNVYNDYPFEDMEID